MTRWDPSQQRVLALDPARHARVLGAPGTGKTAVLVETYGRLIELPGWSEHQVLVIAANRGVAARLRGLIERRVEAPLGGAPVRTPASFAFAVLQRVSAAIGSTPPRLLTGTAHDDAIAHAVEAMLSQSAAHEPLFSPEVMRGEAFRTELRELSRVLDDWALSPREFTARLQARSGGPGRDGEHTPDSELLAHWRAAAELLDRVDAHLRETRPDEYAASALLRTATSVLAGKPMHGASGVAPEIAVPVPRLVLVDDAQELGEGALALLAALALRGARVWAFGDPDIATGAFHGEHVRLLAGVGGELVRRGAPAPPQGLEDQTVVLSTAHRHGARVRGLVQQLSERVGVAGAGEQRAAAAGAASETGEPIQFATVSSASEQLGVIAHRLRCRRLGLDGRDPVAWNEMAVICRSRGEVTRVARALAGHQVPTNAASGGVVLREHALVRELILLLQHALGQVPLPPRQMLELLGGAVGGLDPIALRRLRGELRLQEIRRARSERRDPVALDELIAAAWHAPDSEPVIDSRAGRALRRLGRICAAASELVSRGSTPREVLWAIWDGTGLATQLQREALHGRGTQADEAHRALDAVVALFFTLQRHEEQDSEVPIAELLRELLVSAVPRDSLAARSERDVVTVTTPQGVIGQEFRVVCLLGPQDGVWPNLRSRGSLLGVVALERWLRGDPPVAPSRRDTLHDELRLLVHSCARARDEVLAVALSDEDQHPSVFFGLGREYAVPAPLPSSRLTLRGAVAEMRRRLALDPGDAVARDSLVALALADAPGAHPSKWYGVQPLSTDRPLVDLEADSDARIAVSPSRLEDAERCPLDWAISTLGGGSSGVSQGIGTLLHHALETADGAVSAEALAQVVAAEWGNLMFEARWQEERTRAVVQEMARGLADYLAEFEASERELVGREARLSLEIDRARIEGVADRLEARRLADGRLEVSVVDLKTGGTLPPGPELPQHAQLQAYQLGVRHHAFAWEGDAVNAEVVNGGARLLYVHPDVRTVRGSEAGSTFRQPTQPLMDATAEQAFRERVNAIAQVMAAGSFQARVEHHCSNPYALGGACRLHIIPAVSHA